jgi:hypothetical protein
MPRPAQGKDHDITGTPVTKLMAIEERQQSEELAAFTDVVLNGEPVEGQSRPPLAETVERLALVLERRPPPTRLRQRIRRSVAAEWPRRQPTLEERLRKLLRALASPRYRWAWATAAGLLILVLVTTLFFPTGVQEITGTVVGDIDPGVVAVALGASLVIVLVVIWIRERRR